ncbi:hypothetical protein IJD15_01595 [bacterium]|nr:hypothetical protein [bacterium]
MEQYINKKYIFEFATEEDGEEISALLEQTAFDGDITLVYAKRPNAFVSVNKDSIKSAIVIGRNTETNKIVGVGICQIFEMLVDNNKERIAYLGGLRVDKTANLNIFSAYKLLENFVIENNVKYTYTTILEDNIYAQKMLTKKRKFMPEYKKISDYTVNIYKKNIRFKSNKNIELLKEEEIPKLKKFIEEKTKDIIFFPLNTFNYKDFYVLKDSNNNICACGKLTKQMNHKQLIIKRYSKKLQLLKKLSNPILNLINLPPFPKENEIINYQTLSYVLYDNEICLKDFIKQISHYIDYAFFVYGTTKTIKNIYTPINYKSFVYIVDWNKKLNIEEIKKHNIYIECELL